MFEYYDKDKMLVPIKIWTESIDDIEESCLEQAINLANLPFAHDHIALNFTQEKALTQKASAPMITKSAG